MHKLFQKYSGLFFFLTFIFLFSCKSSESTSVKKDEKTNEKAGEKTQSGNASDEALIKAIIISIDNQRDSSDIQSPCFKAPCFANIKINTVERKGSLFMMPENLPEGVKVFFPFTLFSTNEDLFPNFGKWYPGLKINDKFEAVIRSRPSMNEGVNYIIYDYKKIE